MMAHWGFHHKCEPIWSRDSLETTAQEKYTQDRKVCWHLPAQREGLQGAQDLREAGAGHRACGAGNRAIEAIQKELNDEIKRRGPLKPRALEAVGVPSWTPSTIPGPDSRFNHLQGRG